MLIRIISGFYAFLWLSCAVCAQTLETADFRLRLDKASQTVAALEPKNTPWFDFTPADRLAQRSADRYHHLGDLILRVRAVNPQYAQTYVFDNDHPCVSLDAPPVLEPPKGLYQNRSAQGIARVVCYSPKHNLTLAELTIDEIQRLLHVWQEQHDELGRMADIKHVLIFENKGEVVGVSNPHPHCQIYATNFVFKTIETEARVSQRYLAQTGRVLFKDIIAAEQETGTRIITENDSAIAFVPYFARYAYEVFVAPKKTHPNIATLSVSEIRGERDRLLLLLCQPAELKSMITLPRQLMLWGIDSGKRHSVSGADYGSVRASTFTGLQMISDLKKAKIDYLANISPAEFESEYVFELPQSVRMPTAHPIYENVRVQPFVDLLDQCETSDNPEPLFHELGELMSESHRSYTAVGLNSIRTDLIVELVRSEGPGAGLFGAKINGGGSGGTVAVLGNVNSREAIDRVVARYAKQTGHQPYIFSASSPGSLAFGHIVLAAKICG